MHKEDYTSNIIADNCDDFDNLSDCDTLNDASNRCFNDLNLNI